MFNFGSSQNDDKVGNILSQTTASLKDQLLKGPVGWWVKARRNNTLYVLNKVTSIAIAATFALITLSFKGATLSYNAQMEKATPEQQTGYPDYHIRTIYWFLFVYYSLQAFDEMIELFSVIMQLEKGALGLFFELNYLVGAFLTGYIFWFVKKFDVPLVDPNAVDKDQLQLEYNQMYNWVYFNYIYMYWSIFMVIVITVLYKTMDSKAQSLEDHLVVSTESKVTDDNFKKNIN